MRILLLAILLAGCHTHERTHVSPSLNSTIDCASEFCVDDGFDVQRDGFSFANWNDTSEPHSTVNIQMMVDMFGHSVVCAPGPTETCNATPRALHLIDEWNTALRGGRCEGMAVLSERMFIDLTQPTDFDAAISTVAQLPRGNHRLENEITFWWATQFTDDISEIARLSREKTPSYIVQELIQGLKTSAGYTLALYDHGMGHSVTPYAVSRTNDGWRIHVYDNNYPGIDNHVDVSESTEKWTYQPHTFVDNNSRSVNRNSMRWSGSTGGIELTPMSARFGPFQCVTCDDQSGPDRHEEDVEISLVPLSPHAEVGLEIRTTQGLVSTLRGEPRIDDGVDIMMSKDAAAPALTRVRIPSSLQPFDVRVIASSLSVSPPPILLTVSHPGVASVHLRGMLARHPSGEKAKNASSPLLTIAQSQLSYRADVATTASIAVTSDIAELEIQPGHHLEIVRRDTNDITVANEQLNSVLSQSYDAQELRDNASVRRHLLTYRDNFYESSTITLPSIRLSSTRRPTSSDIAIQENRSAVNQRQEMSVTNSTDMPQDDIENGAVFQPRPQSNTLATQSTVATTPPLNDGRPSVVATFTATPHILHVDQNDSAWLRIGNERALTTVSTTGAITRRDLEGIPVAMTQDDVGSYWILLRQPDRLLQLTSTSLTYYTHPQLMTARSIAFSPQERQLVITGGYNETSYVASMSTQGTFSFVPLEGMAQPDHITVDSNGTMWFVDANGGSISKIGPGLSVDTFRRSTVMARSLTVGPDNAMWFVNNVAGLEIGRISQKGTFSFTSVPSGVETLRDLTSANSNLWFTSRGSIVKIASDTSIMIVPDEHAWGQTDIAFGAGPSLWFSNTNFFSLSRITM